LRERFSPIEFAIVIGAAFGYFIVSSIETVLAGHTLGDSVAGGEFGDAHLYWVVTYELIVAPFVLGVLYIGGWRLQDLKLGPSVPGTVIGVVIYGGMWLAYTLFAMLAEALLPAVQTAVQTWEAYQPSAPPGLLAILLLCIVNPVFEEVFVCGYVIEALRGRFGITTAVNVSVVIRAAYHLYQGLAWQPYHIAYGLVQAYVYARYGKLWPLIVSHALLDFVPLAYYLV
jgi:uncharacterized protein